MYEVSQKQNYIFRTNRLLENTGGSYVIRDITENPHELFRTLFDSFDSSIEVERFDLPKPEKKIVGGGSATYIFNQEEEARDFSRKLSANIIRYFPGLELFLVQEEMDWSQDTLYPSIDDGHKTNVINKMKGMLSEKKDRRKQSVFQESWGVQQACSSSGLPTNPKPSFISKQDIKNVEPRAQELIMKELVGLSTRDYIYNNRFIYENEFLNNAEQYSFLQQNHLEKIFSEDNSSDIKSYLSIISIDGNAMGIKVQRFVNQGFKDNEEYIKEYEDFTKNIDTAYTKAFKKTIRHLLDDRSLWEESIFGDKRKNEQLYREMEHIIPLRPVILSGDDVSFITFGVIGLEVARIYLQYLQQESIPIEGKDYYLNACAGVAIIPHRYPFWLGANLAEQLCDNGKKRLQRDREDWNLVNGHNSSEGYDTCLIDWQVIEAGGAIENIEKFRKQYYTAPDSSSPDSSSPDSPSLTMRPYYIQDSKDRRHFANYEDTFCYAQESLSQSKEDNSSSPGRSKWKELRNVYHRGIEAVEDWVLLNRFTVHESQENKNKNDIKDQYFYKFPISERGNSMGFRLLKSKPVENGKDYAFYYDALEMIDYFVRLSEVKSL